MLPVVIAAAVELNATNKCSTLVFMLCLLLHTTLPRLLSEAVIDLQLAESLLKLVICKCDLGHFSPNAHWASREVNNGESAPHWQTSQFSVAISY